jgi:hypothetical protein
MMPMQALASEQLPAVGAGTVLAAQQQFIEFADWQDGVSMQVVVPVTHAPFSHIPPPLPHEVPFAAMC